MSEREREHSCQKGMSVRLEGANAEQIFVKGELRITSIYLSCILLSKIVSLSYIAYIAFLSFDSL